MTYILMTYLNIWRTFLVWIFLKCNKFREKCTKDLDFAIENNPQLNGKKRFFQFSYLIVNFPSYRNVILNRFHRNPLMFVITRIFFPPCKDLFINVPPEKIGGGLYFQHGFSTIVTAEEIGERCKILQQVTIGFKDGKSPIIGNDVLISVGAIVIGGIKVDNNSVIGAGAVVIHDVPQNAVVAGVPAKIIKS